MPDNKQLWGGEWLIPPTNEFDWKDDSGFTYGGTRTDLGKEVCRFQDPENKWIASKQDIKKTCHNQGCNWGLSRIILRFIWWNGGKFYFFMRLLLEGACFIQGSFVPLYQNDMIQLHLFVQALVQGLCKHGRRERSTRWVLFCQQAPQNSSISLGLEVCRLLFQNTDGLLENNSQYFHSFFLTGYFGVMVKVQA